VKTAELREKELVELENRERELAEQLFKLRFQKSIGSLDNPMKMREVRKEIARIKTILRERERAAVAK
jgi:large subunit ribosomal protein L29